MGKEAMFSPSTLQDWQQAAEALLKGKPLNRLHWHNDPALELDLYYDQETYQQNPPIQVGGGATGKGCRIIEPLLLDETTNTYAQNALNLGSEGVFLINNEVLSNDVNFRNVLPEHCVFMVQELQDLEVNHTVYSQFLHQREAPYTSFEGGVFLPFGGEHFLEKGEFESSAQRIKSHVDQYEPFPNFRTILLDLSFIHLQGASITNELGFYLSLLKSQFELLADQSVEPGAFLKNLQIKVCLGTDFYHEIAKLRAIRLLAFKLFSCYDEDIQIDEISIVAETSRATDAKLDRHTNYLRKTTESMAAYLGGADMLMIHPMEAGGYDPLARRVSRNIGNLLRDESFLNQVKDPLHGSYYVETLTRKLSEKAWEKFGLIESAGGLPNAIQKGIIKGWLEEDRASALESVNARKKTIIGVNNFPNNMEIGKVSGLAGTTDAVFRPFAHIENMVIRLENALREGQLNQRPRVLPVKVGSNAAMQSARMNFSANFLGCGAFEVLHPIMLDQLNNNVDAEVIVFCGADEDYARLSAEILSTCKDQGIILILAGYPVDQLENLKTNGIQYFIHLKSNINEVLADLFKALNIEMN